MSEQGEGSAASQGGATPPGPSRGGQERWPRRRVLLWALGLVPAAAYGGWRLQQWRVDRRQREDQEHVALQIAQYAASLCLSGHPEALEYVMRALKEDSTCAPALLLRACLFMEQGQWQEARQQLSAPSLEGTPEARLLWRLSERRPQAPDWRHAFFDTWQELGQPDFTESELLLMPLMGPLYLLADPVEAFSRAEGVQQLLVATLGLSVGVVYGEEQEEAVFAQVQATESMALLVALHTHLTMIAIHRGFHLRLLPKVEARLRELAGPSPRTLQLALLFSLPGSSPEAPFERQELETLERLVALPVWKEPSSEQTFLEVRKHLEGFFLSPARHAWMLAVLAQALPLAERVLARARATKERLTEDERRWMGKLLWEVGARLREQRSHLELDAGLRLQVFGSELTGHSETRVESLALWVELGRWEKALERAAFYRWPLPSLQEEACEPRAREEHAWMRAFAGKGALP